MDVPLFLIQNSGSNIKEIEVFSKRQVVFEGKAPMRFKGGGPPAAGFST